jgi:putative ABC transport system permease protein
LLSPPSSQPLNKLVVNNLLHRPLRSLISIFAVAIEVVMILSVAAIMFGMLNGQKARNTGIGNDLFVNPPNTSFLRGISGAPAPIRIADVLRRVPHVAVVSPVIIQFTTGSALENIYGIDYESFNALKPFVFLAGGPFHGPNDVIIDDYAAKAGKAIHVGDTLHIMAHDFRVSGIVEHGKGGRKFIPITTMGELIGSEGKASTFYVKSDDPRNEQAIIAAIHAIPGMADYQVQTLDQWLSLMTPEHLPAFNASINTVIGIAVIIGFLAAAVYLGALWLIAGAIMVGLGLLVGLGARKEI